MAKFAVHRLYKEVKSAGLTGGACEYCAKAFKVDGAVTQAGIKFKGEYNGQAI